MKNKKLEAWVMTVVDKTGHTIIALSHKIFCIKRNKRTGNKNGVGLGECSLNSSMKEHQIYLKDLGLIPN